MKKLIVTVDCLLSADKLEQLRRDFERQFESGGAIALDGRYKWEIIEVDAIEVVAASVNSK